MSPRNIVPCPYEDCDGCVDSDDGGDDECCHCRRPVAWVGRTPHVLMARCAACGTDVREVDYDLRLFRTTRRLNVAGRNANTPEHAEAVLHDLIGTNVREVMGSVFLDGRGVVIGDLDPTTIDLATFTLLLDASRIVRIPLVDLIIVTTEPHRCFSVRVDGKGLLSTARPARKEEGH